MENELKQEDLIEQPATSAGEQVEESTTQDPLKAELERVQGKQGGRTEAEKAAFSLRKNAERARELGIDPADVLGYSKPKKEETAEVEDEDEKPLTMGMWKRMQQETATKTALQLAEDITDATERELTKYHIENSIRSSGNPKEDFDLARSIVNAKKNAQIMQMAAQKPEAKQYVSGGTPAKTDGMQIEFTKDELTLMRPPFNLTKEEILKARKG